MQIRITSIEKRRRPAIAGLEPAGSDQHDYFASGPVIEREGWTATIALIERGFTQARDKLLGDEEHFLSLHPEDVVALHTTPADEGPAFDVVR